VNIYVLERNDHSYDEIVSVVVVAPDELTARKTAASYDRMGYGPDTVQREFLDPDESTCELIDIGSQGEPRVIHDYLRHG
jgi:hypothetical protein